MKKLEHIIFGLAVCTVFSCQAPSVQPGGKGKDNHSASASPILFSFDWKMCEFLDLSSFENLSDDYKDSGFMMYGYELEKDWTGRELPGFMSGSMVSYDGSAWRPESDFFWSASGKNYRFFGTAPAGLDGASVSYEFGGAPVLEYCVPSGVGARRQILIAYSDVVCSCSGTEVPMGLCGLLSPLYLSIDSSCQAGTFKSISFVGFYGSGTISLDRGLWLSNVYPWAIMEDTGAKIVDDVDYHHRDGSDCRLFGPYYFIPQEFPDGAEIVFEFVPEGSAESRTVRWDLFGMEMSVGSNQTLDISF